MSIGSSIRYEPVYLYHIASNLEADKEYTFEVYGLLVNKYFRSL